MAKGLMIDERSIQHLLDTLIPRRAMTLVTAESAGEGATDACHRARS